MICSFRLRPPLRIESRLGVEEAVEKLRRAKRERSADLTATISGRYVIVRIHEARQHFGSPQLTFEIEPREAGCALNGLFMPMPAVWTAFMALYALFLFIGFSGAMYGVAQVMIQHHPSGFYAIPVSILLVGLVYLGACVGQRRGQTQMDQLRRFVQDSLRD